MHLQMKQTVYVETSVFSYLTAPTRDIVMAAHQQLTREWWEKGRNRVELFVSQAVVREASRGDPQAAVERLEVLKGIALVELDRKVLKFAQRIAKAEILPKKAKVDMTHLAAAVVHKMDYLLTWNCKHLANAALRKQIEQVCEKQGYSCPVICTPEELLGETS